MGESRRRGWLADFFIRLWQEKPLGTACGILLILILILIFVAILPRGWRPIRIGKYTWQTYCKRHPRSTSWGPITWGETCSAAFSMELGFP